MSDSQPKRPRHPGPRKKGARGPGAASLRTAVELLAAEAGKRLAAHPWGHLLGSRREALSLTLELPLNARNGEIEAAGEAASAALAASVEAALTHWAVFKPGRVYCLRCASAGCEHSLPSSAREVFAGYGSTGLPRFADLGQWLLEARHPRVDQLYGTPPRLVTAVAGARELTAELLPAYRDAKTGFRLHGQVAAGFYSVPDDAGHREPLALTFQVVSSRTRRQRRRFGLNLLGLGPGGEDVEAVYDRLGRLPWAGAVRWAQTVLESVEKAAAARKPPKPERLGQRLEGLLQALARRLEKGERSRDRRTRHAEERHDQGDRPTRMALADLKRSGRSGLLFDTRRRTLVALGGKGRAHVFNLEGKLVTSVRLAPPAVERRKRQGRWRPATDDEVAAFEKRVGGVFEAPQAS